MVLQMMTTVLNHDKVWLGLFSGDITKPSTHFRHTGDKQDHFDDSDDDGDGDDVDDVGDGGYIFVYFGNTHYTQTIWVQREFL